MRLAAIYNVWDGEELLKFSVNSVRHVVDKIIVVWQNKSNWGNHHSPEWAFEGLDADKFIFYSPTNARHPHVNETRKRRIGLEEARKDCTHFMFMDADECYFKDELKYAWDMVKRDKLTGCACPITTYYKDPTYQVTPHYKYYVPLIHEIQDRLNIGEVHYPVAADPTRKCSATQNFHILQRHECEMHHYSFIRKDIAKKLLNSSARMNFNDISRNVESFNNFKPGNGLIYFSKEQTIKVVPNYLDLWQ